MAQIVRIATKEEGEEIAERASAWFGNHGIIFADAGSVAHYAVSEYIANSRGFTLYASQVGTEWNGN